MPDGPGYIVRDALASDRASLIALNRELQAAEVALRPSRISPEALPDSYIDNLLDRRDRAGCGLLVAAGAEGIVAFAAWREDRDPLEVEPREILVTDLAVAADHRRRGIATALIREAVRRASAHGVGRVLITTLNANEAALAAYQGLGFRPILTTLELKTETGKTSSPV